MQIRSRRKFSRIVFEEELLKKAQKVPTKRKELIKKSMQLKISGQQRSKKTFFWLRHRILKQQTWKQGPWSQLKPSLEIETKGYIPGKERKKRKAGKDLIA